MCDVTCDEQSVNESGWLERAVELARENVAGGGRPFATLVVRDDEIIATGVNTALVDVDPPRPDAGLRLTRAGFAT